MALMTADTFDVSSTFHETNNFETDISGAILYDWHFLYNLQNTIFV